MSRFTDFLRKARIDVSPLRGGRDFRLLFIGGTVTFLGSMVTFVALPYQAKVLTNSFLAVGLLGAVEIVPLVIFGLYGGAIADRYDRRKVVFFTEMLFAVLSAGLLVNSLLPNPQLWVLYVAAALLAVVDGLQRPSLDALVPRLVPPHQLAGAGALSSLRTNFGLIIGPALGGFLVTGLGFPSAYIFDLATFAVSLACLALMHAVPPLYEHPEDHTTWHRIVEGLQYAKGRKDLLGTYLVDIFAMLFAYPNALYPFVVGHFHATWALGFMYSAPAVGSLVATLTSGWTSHMHHHGRIVVFAAMAWGASIVAFGLAPGIWWALIFLAFAGAADMVSGLFRGLMWDLTIPDEVRGRMAGVELLSYSIGPQLGQVRSTAIAQVTSLRTSLVSGGLACIAACGLVGVVMRPLWNFDSRTDENAVRERNIREQRMRDTRST
jgi:MFS family permease